MAGREEEGDVPIDAQFWLIGGPNGAGKTTLARNVLHGLGLPATTSILNPATTSAVAVARIRALSRFDDGWKEFAASAYYWDAGTVERLLAQAAAADAQPDGAILSAAARLLGVEVARRAVPESATPEGRVDALFAIANGTESPVDEELRREARTIAGGLPGGARSLRAAGALLVRKFPAFADRSAVELLRGIARCDLLVRCHSPTTICSSMLPSPTFGRGWSRPWAG